MDDERPPSLAWAMWKRFLAGGVTIVVLTAAATATATLLQVAQFAQVVFPARNHLKLGTLVTAAQAGAPETFMVIGSDKRAQSRALQDRSSPPHSDTLMLIRMDPGQGQTSVLSIPRDLKVQINGPAGVSTQKINAAYSIGGARLALKTVKSVLKIPITHVVDVNFKAFREAVDAVSCVYVDVDHRYYHSNAGLALSQRYAEINVPAGYQRLCGQQALDYVRYRHTDSDFVRVARQQDFIRQFKAQVGVQGLIDHLSQLERAGGRSIQTDIRGTATTLRLIKLLAYSLGRPIRQVHFQATPGPSYVTATAYDVQQTVRDFLHGPAKPPPPRTNAHRRGRRSHRRQHRVAAVSNGLGPVPGAFGRQARRALRRAAFPVYYPRRMIALGSQEAIRTYSLPDEQHHLHHAYRIVFSRGLAGEYYGVQGMDWTNPPLLTSPSDKRKVGGRSYLLFYDGRHLRWVAWTRSKSVYWVSNTLLEGLTNQQMMTIAESAQALR